MATCTPSFLSGFEIVCKGRHGAGFAKIDSMTAFDPQKALGLSSPPVAVGFLDSRPDDLSRWDRGAVPAGCVFWRQAMEGRSFYTEPRDHWNCAVGSHTHGIPLPVELGPVLEDTVGFMVESGYIEMREIAGIPTLSTAPQFIAYAPVDDAPFRPDLVLLAARPAAAMLIYEAAIRSGAASAFTPSLGRPACAILPFAKSRDSAAASFGCKGNRTFTGLSDSELYFCIPGGKWEDFTSALGVLLEANEKLEQHYINHRSQFPILA